MAQNMAHSHQKQCQRRLGRGIAMMSLKCQSDVGIDGKGTRSHGILGTEGGQGQTAVLEDPWGADVCVEGD